MKIETVKYMGICNERILTHKGFKTFDKINQSTIRLFNTASELHKYLDEKMFRRSYIKDTIAVKIKVTYEVIE